MFAQNEPKRQTCVRAITVKGQRLRVIVRPGDGMRTPLLLMSGLGAELEVFQQILDELDPTLEVIAFDVPGIGGSPPPALPYIPASLACLVAGMLDALVCEQVDILGVSWGGWLNSLPFNIARAADGWFWSAPVPVYSWFPVVHMH